MSKLELKITGMSCAACISHVTRALGDVPGVRSVVVDLARQMAYVEAEGNAPDEHALIEVVEEEGYGAERILSSESASVIPLTTVSTGCACCR